MSEHSACQLVQHFCVLSQAWLCFKTLMLQRLLRHGFALILWGRVSLHFSQCWLVGEDSDVTVQLFRVYGESRHTACARFCSPHLESLFPHWWAGGRLHGALSVFCLWRGHIISPKCPQALASADFS